MLLKRQADVAREVGLPQRTLQGWCQRGVVSFTKVQHDRKRYFTPDEVEAVRVLAAQHTTMGPRHETRRADPDRLVRAVERIADALEAWVTRP